MQRSTRPSPLPESLASALAAYGRQDYGARVQSVYQRLPETTCQRRGHCCGLLPPLAPVEMLGWLVGLSVGPEPDHSDKVCDLLDHFLTNAATRRPCPWAVEGACLIYGQRSLACRCYGLWSTSAYDQRRQTAIINQENIAQAWAGLGVTLPDEVLAPGPSYCDRVRVGRAGDKLPIDDDSLRACENDLTDLGLELPSDPDLAASGGDISHLLARLILGPRACLEAKVAVTKAMLGGQEELAREMRQGHQQAARAWAKAWREEKP